MSSNDYNLKDIGEIKVKDYKSPFLYVLSFRNEKEEHVNFDISNNKYIDVHANVEIGPTSNDDDISVFKDFNTKLRKCTI